MSNIGVYITNSDGGSGIYRLGEPGTVYTKTLTTTETTVPSLSKTVTVASHTKTLTATQTVAVNVAKMILQGDKAVTSGTLASLQTDTTIASACTAQTTTTVPSLRKQVNLTKTTTQSSVPSVALQFISGSSHSTFPIELSSTQAQNPSVTRGIQTIKSTMQSVYPSLEMAVTRAGVSNILLTMLTTQGAVPTLDIVVQRVTGRIMGAPAAASRRQQRRVIQVELDDEEVVTVKSEAQARDLLKKQALARAKEVKPKIAPTPPQPAPQAKVDPAVAKALQEEEEIALLLGA